MIQSIGKLTVAVPGTLVRATSGQANPAQPFSCHGVLFQALPANVGRVYIGSSVLNRAALTGVFSVLVIPTATIIPSFSVALTIAPNGIKLDDFWVDADTATDGVIITVLIA
jgi:hypothetical protein